MNKPIIHLQSHGYRNGHQLLESTVRLDRSDQDTIDRLSDLSGQIRPGEVIPPYITIYPLPSRTYQVVAKTWPDLKAPRAGCVLTKSSLVPRESWNENPSLQWLLRQLTPPDGIELQPMVSENFDEHFPAGEDPRTLELVEALFLEVRKPIVVFDAIEADLLATRLVTAFWPAFRSEFSVCTYALGPRKIGGRDFDLVFAPKSVRSRFSDWSGRKIEAGSPKTTRHRWSAAVANAIFQSPHPTLASGDSLGMLGMGGPGDEATFRKSLLWNELAEKAGNSPSAVLGMLDIINSQPSLESKATTNALTMLKTAMRSAVDLLSSADAWAFLQNLESKVSKRDVLEPISAEVSNVAKGLTASDPEAAIGFAQRFQEASMPFPDKLLLGMANGLGAANDASFEYERIPSRLGAFFVANSSAFALALAQCIRVGKTPASRIAPYFQSMDTVLSDKAAGRFLSEINSREFAPLLPFILHHNSSGELTRRIAEIIHRSGLTFSEFDEVLIDSIRDVDTMAFVRGMVARDVQASHADRFLVKTIRLIPGDVDWLFDGPVKGSRSATLLATVLSKQSDRTVVEAQRDPGMRRRMLDILARDVGVSSGEIARILVLGAASIEELLKFGQLVLEHSTVGQKRLDLISKILEAALFQAEPDDMRVEQLVADNFELVEARQLVRWSTSGGISTLRLARNLAILTRLSDVRRLSISNLIDELSYNLSKRGPTELSAETCSLWACLLWDSRAISPLNHLKAATTSLAAAVDLTQTPVAEVIAASFPAVYQELVTRNNDDRESILSLFFALPRMLADDWDRAKPARHRLVDAFMNSTWPPSYLLLSAARAGIVDRICLRVVRQRGGKKYLRSAVTDLDRLSTEDVVLIQNGLDQFSSTNMNGEWD